MRDKKTDYKHVSPLKEGQEILIKDIDSEGDWNGDWYSAQIFSAEVKYHVNRTDPLGQKPGHIVRTQCRLYSSPAFEFCLLENMYQIPKPILSKQKETT